VIAAIRPDSWGFPLFLHVFGAMVLFGALLATVTLSAVGARVPALARSTFWALLGAAVPAWIVMRIGAQWIYSKEGFSGDNDPTWLGIGFIVADLGLVFLLLATGFAFWWKRSGKRAAGFVVTALASIYTILLVVAWLAMSGKWS
jgi:hypothetical protein